MRKMKWMNEAGTISVGYDFEQDIITISANGVTVEMPRVAITPPRCA